MNTPSPDIDLTTLTPSLREWLPSQRWFAGKGRAIHGIRVVHAVPLHLGEPDLLHVVIAIDQADGTQLYQLPLGLRTELPSYLRSAGIGPLGTRFAYDAAGDPEAAAHLLDGFDSSFASGASSVVFEREPGVEVRTGLHARLVGAEQSNSSLVFGQHYILKVFRRLTHGHNRELELHRALREVGCEHVVDTLGSIHGEINGQPVVFAMLQRFLPDAVEGWRMATASVRDLMAEADLHAEEVGGDFAGEARRLGVAVATVHADLANALGSRPATHGEIDAMVDRMHHKLDETVAAVPELAPYLPASRATFEAARAMPGPVSIQHVHGDLHLGQALRTTNAGWVLIDFEGEPAASVAERDTLTSPLRDVAGMLRSFDYAAYQMLVGDPAEQAPADHQLSVRAREWASRNTDAFCAGYAEIAGDPRQHAELLQAFELEKAFYEVHYEQRNRPDWLPIPLGAIARLTRGSDPFRGYP